MSGKNNGSAITVSWNVIFASNIVEASRTRRAQYMASSDSSTSSFFRKRSRFSFGVTGAEYDWFCFSNCARRLIILSRSGSSISIIGIVSAALFCAVSLRLVPVIVVTSCAFARFANNESIENRMKYLLITIIPFYLQSISIYGAKLDKKYEIY